MIELAIAHALLDLRRAETNEEFVSLLEKFEVDSPEFTERTSWVMGVRREIDIRLLLKGRHESE